MLKIRGLTELIKLKKWVLSAERTVKVVPLKLIELGKMGAFKNAKFVQPASWVILVLNLYAALQVMFICSLGQFQCNINSVYTRS